MAKAFDGRNDWDDARAEYDARGRSCGSRGSRPLSQDAIIARLQQLQMEARSYRDGTLGISREAARGAGSADPARRHAVRPEVDTWLASSRGMVALIRTICRLAASNSALAVKARSSMPELFDLRTRLAFRQRQAFSFIRLGDGARAESAVPRAAGGLRHG